MKPVVPRRHLTPCSDWRSATSYGQTYTYGLPSWAIHHMGRATFIHLCLREIPAADLRNDRVRHLEGTVLVLDSSTGRHLTTAYGTVNGAAATSGANSSGG